MRLREPDDERLRMLSPEEAHSVILQSKSGCIEDSRNPFREYEYGRRAISELAASMRNN